MTDLFMENRTAVAESLRQGYMESYGHSPAVLAFSRLDAIPPYF
jgi:hypothetical protein